MSINNRPPPLYPSPPRPRCPVCGHVSYSATGVHPQCSLRKADAERMRRLAGRARTIPPPAKTQELSPWQRVCPRCKVVVHIRKKICECGCKLPQGRASAST
jgi:hypothetical protein